METETRSLAIRVLYTINSAEPYILARTSYKVDVKIISPRAPHLSVGSEPIYGKIPLLPCLHVVCQSSPELVPSSFRDFIVYVIDPIESHLRMPLSSLPNTPPTVAVGYGYLSDAIKNDNSPFIIGTLASDGIYPDAIEVIFSLKEFPKPSSSRTNSVVPDKKPAKRPHGALFTTDPLRWPAQDKSTTADPSLSASNPPIPPFVRPPAVQDASAQFSTPQHVEMFPPTLNHAGTVVPQSANQAETVNTLLAALAGSPENQQRLLSLIGSIDSVSSVPNPNLALAQMIGALLASAPPIATPPAAPPTSVAPSRLDAPLTFFSTAASSTSDYPAEIPKPHPEVEPVFTPPNTDHNDDDEIVVLDKENVNPVAFRRRGNEKGKMKEISHLQHKAFAPQTNQAEPVLRARVKNTPQPLGSTPVGPNPRKRTLSEFMEERERERGRDTTRKRSTKVTSKSSPSFRSFLSSRGAQANSSAGSSSRLGSHVASDPAWDHPSFLSSSSAAPAGVPSTSPRRSSSGTNASLRRKPYVVPDWARTNTATLPRAADGSFLTAESDLAEPAARKRPVKKEKEREKEKERPPRPRKPRPTIYKDPAESIAERSFHGPVPLVPVSPRAANRGGGAASPLRPVVASSTGSLLFPLPFAPSSSHNIFSPSDSAEPPSTPPRKREAHADSDSATPEGQEDSLFTPQSQARSQSQSTRGARTPRTPRRLPSLYSGFSMSPTRSAGRGRRTLSKAHAATKVKTKAGRTVSQPTPSSSRSASSMPDAPSAESYSTADLLSDGLDTDMEAPLDSIPIASSDGEFDGDRAADERNQGIKRLGGLPMSSPLPPSSPILTPSDTGVDDWDEGQEQEHAENGNGHETTICLPQLELGGATAQEDATSSEQELLALLSRAQHPDSDMFSDAVLDEFLTSFGSASASASTPASNPTSHGLAPHSDPNTHLYQTEVQAQACTDTEDSGCGSGEFTGLSDFGFDTDFGLDAGLFGGSAGLDMDFYGSGAGSGDGQDVDVNEVWAFLRPLAGDSLVPLPGLSASEAPSSLPASDLQTDKEGKDSVHFAPLPGPGGGEFAIDPLKMAESIQGLLSGCAL